MLTKTAIRWTVNSILQKTVSWYSWMGEYEVTRNLKRHCFWRWIILNQYTEKSTENILILYLVQKNRKGFLVKFSSKWWLSWKNGTFRFHDCGTKIKNRRKYKRATISNDYSSSKLLYLETHDLTWGTRTPADLQLCPFFPIVWSPSLHMGRQFSGVPCMAVMLCNVTDWGSCAPRHHFGNACLVKAETFSPSERRGSMATAYGNSSGFLSSRCPSCNSPSCHLALCIPWSEAGLGELAPKWGSFAYRCCCGHESTPYCWPRGPQLPIHVRGLLSL